MDKNRINRLLPIAVEVIERSLRSQFQMSLEAILLLLELLLQWEASQRQLPIIRLNQKMQKKIVPSYLL